MNNLVQSSNNLAKITIGNGQYKISCHARSFIESERNDLVNAITNSFLSTEAKVTPIGPYPCWNPDPNSKTLGV